MCKALIYQDVPERILPEFPKPLEPQASSGFACHPLIPRQMSHCQATVGVPPNHPERHQERPPFRHRHFQVSATRLRFKSDQACGARLSGNLPAQGTPVAMTRVQGGCEKMRVGDVRVIAAQERPLHLGGTRAPHWFPPVDSEPSWTKVV